MRKSKTYYYVKFSPDVLQEVREVLEALYSEKQGVSLKPSEMTVGFDNEQWEHNSQDEFFADIRKNNLKNYDYELTSASYPDGVFEYFRVSVNYWKFEAFPETRVTVSADSRPSIEKIFEIFEKNLDVSRLPTPSPPPKPKVFIGHGRSELWRDLKDHLQDKHGVEVEAYEIGARAGHTIRDILDELLESSTIAFLIMTGEDETLDGKMRARQNVVHEIGLFQGRLGFSKGIVLFEEGTEEFSNIQGIQQIRFAKGNIRETFGDVLATLKREFPDSTI